MRKPIILAALLAATTMAAPASAAIYNYDTQIGNGIGDVTVSIDTESQTARFKGQNMDLVLTDSDLANFNPNLTEKGRRYKADAVSGTFSRYGKTYDAFWSQTPKHTQFRLGTDKNFFWIYGKNQANNKVYDFDGKGPGANLTSTSSSSGGKPVPEPGMLGLFGLGVAALLFGRFQRRRRRKLGALAAT